MTIDVDEPGGGHHTQRVTLGPVERRILAAVSTGVIAGIGFLILLVLDMRTDVAVVKSQIPAIEKRLDKLEK